MDSRVYSEEFRIYHFQSDAKSSAKLTSLCHWLQEAATNHADSLGFGTQDLHKLGYFWAIHQWSIIVDKYPITNDRIKVNTWVSSQKGPFTEREYQILDDSGQSLVRASSLWFALDFERRKPVSIDIITEALPIIEALKSYRSKPLRIKQRPPDLTKLKSSPHVKYYDLDENRHVNNVGYIDWVLGSFKLELFSQMEVASIDVNFLGEISAADTIDLWVKKISEEEYFHKIMTPDGREILVMYTHFRKRV